MPNQEDTRLTRALSEYIYTSWGMSVPLDEWNEEALPEHLRIRIAVTDEKGQVIESGPGLGSPSIKGIKANIDKGLLKKTRKEWERSGLGEVGLRGYSPGAFSEGKGSDRL